MFVDIIKEYEEKIEEMRKKQFRNIVILIIVFILTILWDEQYINKKWHERNNEVYYEMQEMKEKIYELAEENDNFIRDYKEVIELEEEDYHTSTAFEEVLGEFENDIENIGW